MVVWPTKIPVILDYENRVGDTIMLTSKLTRTGHENVSRKFLLTFESSKMYHVQIAI